jgi:hypothetical protein
MSRMNGVGYVCASVDVLLYFGDDSLPVIELP